MSEALLIALITVFGGGAIAAVIAYFHEYENAFLVLTGVCTVIAAGCIVWLLILYGIIGTNNTSVEPKASDLTDPNFLLGPPSLSTAPGIYPSISPSPSLIPINESRSEAFTENDYIKNVDEISGGSTGTPFDEIPGGPTGTPFDELGSGANSLQDTIDCTEHGYVKNVRQLRGYIVKKRDDNFATYASTNVYTPIFDFPEENLHKVRLTLAGGDFRGTNIVIGIQDYRTMGVQVSEKYAGDVIEIYVSECNLYIYSLIDNSDKVPQRYASGHVYIDKCGDYYVELELD